MATYKGSKPLNMFSMYTASLPSRVTLVASPLVADLDLIMVGRKQYAHPSLVIGQCDASDTPSTAEVRPPREIPLEVSWKKSVFGNR